MDIAELPSITITDPPFNDASDLADLVIRTSDKVDFFVHRAFLLLRSPSSFFRHVLEGSHPTEEKSDLPVLELLSVGMALDKYCMDHAFERFVQTVIASPLIKEQPLRVFAVAVAHGWKVLGETAARNTLGVPLDGVESDVEELDGISARHLQRLLNYRKRCRETTRIRWMIWLSDQPGCELLDPSSKCQRCQETLQSSRFCGGKGRLFSHSWLNNSYMKLVKEKLLVDPRPQVAFDDGIIRGAILASIKECNSDSWIRGASSQIHGLAQLVAAEIEKRISEVPLEIEWTK
ncbi:hypothetical protein EDD85DRAFT_236755 [Armillaria nabsnona]|nr:hypothetical protein EDD85DRAFT_236755 [Armillaria nabsnona]